MAKPSPGPEEPEKLTEAVSQLLEECRMVLPGVQALFGFQLVAVTNQRFKEFSHGEQILHLVATGLTVLSIGMLMMPAAYHRQVDPESVSKDFVQLASRMLVWSMAPLAVGLGIEFHLIGRLILNEVTVPAVAALGLVIYLLGLWYLLPRVMQRRKAGLIVTGGDAPD